MFLISGEFTDYCLKKKKNMCLPKQNKNKLLELLTLKNPSKSDEHAPICHNGHANHFLSEHCLLPLFFLSVHFLLTSLCGRSSEGLFSSNVLLLLCFSDLL